MDDAVGQIRPETLALHALIEASIGGAEEGAQGARHDALLFLGNRHASFPTLVVQDPVLEPVDKLVWMTIRLQAGEAAGSTAFPSYDYIRKMANIASKSTVARAIAILRATRWLSLCARLRASTVAVFVAMCLPCMTSRCLWQMHFTSIPATCRF